MPLVGLDIGGTRLKAGLLTREGAVLAAANCATPLTPETFREAVAGLLGEVAPDPGTVEAVGIASKGIVDPATTRVVTLPGTLRFLEGTRLAELQPFGVPVRADNDARAAMAGEAAWGAARGRHDAILLTLGTGVGGAAIAGGKLLHGATGVGGHLGHVVLDPDGPLCICGNRGCLETAFSACAIESEALAAVRRGAYHADAASLTCRRIFELAAGGDEFAAGVINRAIGRLAAALSGLMMVFDPEVVIVGGQIAEAGAALLDPLSREVHERTRAFLRRDVPLQRAQVTDSVMGAAALALQALTESEPQL